MFSAMMVVYVRYVHCLSNAVFHCIQIRCRDGGVFPEVDLLLEVVLLTQFQLTTQ